MLRSINLASSSSFVSRRLTTTTTALLATTATSQQITSRRFIAFNPETLKTQMKKNRSGFGDIDPDRMAQFEEMQTGMAKAQFEKKRKEREDFLALPRDEQIRRFMIDRRKFDVDLVRRNDMNVQEEYKLFKDTVKKNDRAANRGFWIPLISCTAIIWGGSAYWVFWWY